MDNAGWAFKTRELLERAEEEGRTIWPTGRNEAGWSRKKSPSQREVAFAEQMTEGVRLRETPSVTACGGDSSLREGAKRSKEG